MGSVTKFQSHLYGIERLKGISCTFVVRAKKDLQYKCCKWRRRLPKNILTDAVIEFTEYNSYRKYPEKLRL